MLQTTEPTNFEWSAGFAVYFVGHIPHVQADVVLFELGEGALGAKASIALDKDGALAFVVVDRLGKRASATLSWGPILTAPFFLLCELVPISTGEWRLSLELNGKPRAEATARLDLPATTKVLQSLGADLTGEHNAAFTMTEVGIFGAAVPSEHKAQLLAYVVNRYALGFPHG